VMLAVRVGATFDLHRRVSGLAGLAMLADHRRAEYWKQSGESAQEIKVYEVQLAEIRARGYAHADSPIVMGVQDCSVPVLGSGAILLGVLCVSHLCRKDDAEGHAEMVQAVVDCARQISAEFGSVVHG